MLERFPPLGQQREAALAQAAHRAQKRVTCPGINVQLFGPGRLLYRDEDAMTCAFVAGIGQDGHGIQERPQYCEDILAGGGQVMDIARQHIRDPQRYPGRVKKRLDLPAEIMRLPRIPQAGRLPLAADGFLPAPVSVHDLAVQDQVRHALSQGPLPLPPLAPPCRPGVGCGAPAASARPGCPRSPAPGAATPSIPSSRSRYAVDWGSSWSGP